MEEQMHHRKLIHLLLLVLFYPLIPRASAQATPTPATPGWVFSVSGGYSNVTNAPTNNGVAIVTELKLASYTSRKYFTDLSARGDTFIIQNPNVTGAYIGPQATLFKSSLNGQDTEFFANVGFGDIRSNDPANVTQAKFSWKIGGGINIQLSDHTFIRPLDVSYIRGSVFQGGGTVIGNHLQAAAMLGVRF